MQKGIRVQGWDLALTHCGIVELTDGELTDYWYLTNNKTSASKHDQGTFLDLVKNVDKQQMHMERLVKVIDFLASVVIAGGPHYVGIEDYALMANTYSHLKGEVGGGARMVCHDTETPFRLHDPLSIKMFATGKGNAKKDAIEAAVLDRWGVEFSHCNKSEKDRTTSEDLCDAFAIAKMVWVELQLRNGEIELKDLNEKEIQVFNRVTKSYPVNLLGRDWIK